MRLNYKNGYYEGSVSYDEPNGYGTFYDYNGSKYVGYFINGHIQTGKFYFKDGTVYEGPFDSNWDFHGKGKMTWKSGDTYTGEFRHGEKTGQGVYRWKKGGYLEGYFEKFVIKKGTRVFDDGSKYEGTFDNDEKYHGKGKYYYTDGCIYDGDWLHGERTGRGVVWSTKNKYRYEGYFLNGDRHGHGKLRYSNEDDRVYEGEFKEGKMEGKFIITFDNGKKIERYYEDDHIADGILEEKNDNGETSYYYYKDGDFFGL